MSVACQHVLRLPLGAGRFLLPITCNHSNKKRFFRAGATIGGSHLSDPENKGSQQSGINFDTLGSWNNRIEMSMDVDQSIRRGKPIPKISLLNVAYNSLLGRRKVNEDRHRVAELMPNVLYFGIYDGHGGALAADYASEEMEEHLRFWMRKEKDLSTVLNNAFIDLNNVFTRHVNTYCAGSDEVNSGTTATVCILRNNVELVVGHVGDSRAILSRNGRPIRLTIDHEPELPTEADRIRSHGGQVTWNSIGVGQVNGRLAMTRSIGDADLKRYGVTAQPQIRSIEVKHSKDAFLILTTDGINFVLSDQEIVDNVGQCESPEEAVRLITDQALQYGSEDNSSALVIPFAAWGKNASAKASTYSFGRNVLGRRFC